MELLCIYTKQVSTLLHVSERQAQRTLKAIREEVNKKKKQAVTIKEFCDYKGFDEATVLAALR
jgi:hypothetical protein